MKRHNICKVHVELIVLKQNTGIVFCDCCLQLENLLFQLSELKGQLFCGAHLVKPSYNGYIHINLISMPTIISIFQFHTRALNQYIV